jgi:hypothetical protein
MIISPEKTEANIKDIAQTLVVIVWVDYKLLNISNKRIEAEARTTTTEKQAASRIKLQF